MALTIAVNHFADLPEQEIAVRGGDIKQESLWAALSELGHQLEYRGGDRRVVVPHLDRPVQNGRVGRVAIDC